MAEEAGKVEVAMDDVEDEDSNNTEGKDVTLAGSADAEADAEAEAAEEPTGCCGRKKKKKEPEKKLRAIQWWSLYRQYRPLNRPLLALAVLAAIANGCTFPVFSIIFGNMFQVFYNEDDDMRAQIRWYALGFLGLGFVSFTLYYVQTCILSMSGEQVSTKMRKRVFKAVMENDVAFIDRHTSGDITSRLASDIALVQLSCSEKVGLLILNLSQAFAGVIVAFVYGWKMTLVLLSVTPLLGIAFSLFAKLLMQSSGKGQDAYSEANSIASEAIQGFRTVLSFIREDYEVKRFSDSLDRTYREGRKRSHFLGMGMGFVNLVMFGTYALGFWYGGQLVIKDEMEVGDMLIVFFAIIMGAMGLGQAGSLAPDFAKGAVAAGVLQDMIDEKPTIDKNIGGPKPTPNFPGDISFENISFSYPARPDAKVLKGVTFSVPSGSVVALVGQSGGGKSTVLQLLERFYDPVGGRIMVDGQDLKEMDLEAYRAQIGLVAQEPILFSGSIIDNIRYGRLDAPEEDVIAAAKAANAHNFISDLPSGYNTLVGEKGSQLSGGQKQRVAIARAILKDPKLLLLDEATSALDTESEELVQEALDNLMVNRTTIVIAHRLSTIRHADIIYVFDHGKLVESGNHEQLMELKRYYYALVFRQVEKENGDDDEEEEGGDGLARKRTRTRLNTRPPIAKVQTYDEIQVDEESKSS